MFGYGFVVPSSSNMKLKRKEIEEFNDDFSDFSLSTPSRKIRRLDAELPPIIEEEEAEIVMGPPPAVSANNVNEERAIVLFKPIHQHTDLSSPNLTLSVHPDVINGFQNPYFGSSNFGDMKWAGDEKDEENKNKCLALVPWVPSEFSSVAGTEVAQTEAPESMDAEEFGEAAMDVEESNGSGTGQTNAYNSNGTLVGEGLQPWQQQHCIMIPQLPQTTSTPITWFR